MEVAGLLRSLGALGCVLGLLAGALWAVRRFDIALPGRAGGGQDRRLSVVERVQLDAKRSLVLVRRDDAEHLFVLLPDRVAVLETGILPAKPGSATPASPVFRDMVLCPSLEDKWYDA